MLRLTLQHCALPVTSIKLIFMCMIFSTYVYTHSTHLIDPKLKVAIRCGIRHKVQNTVYSTRVL
jgi:hypothetical protein